MMYSFKANVFNERLGSQFGTITHIIVAAKNEEDARIEAKKSFDRYVAALKKHHNINGNGKVRKVINTFNYNNLTLE